MPDRVRDIMETKLVTISASDRLSMVEDMILILDETTFPKQGPHSVGTARQYCGALGKVANCQVAVTAALWTGRHAWPLGALLHLPKTWTDDPIRRRTARIPAGQRFQEKWRLALTLWRQSRAAGLTFTAVVADAEYGDNGTVRWAFHRAKLPYALGISPTLIRSLMRFGDDPVLKHDLSTLRVLGSTGEPWNPAPWMWFFNTVGRGRSRPCSRAAPVRGPSLRGWSSR